MRERINLDRPDGVYYLGPATWSDTFDNSGNFIARPSAPVDGNYPLRTTTFFAPRRADWRLGRYTF